MEGNPADLTAYKDDGSDYQLRDHTYIGNGCSGEGSITPCETRIVQTTDNEDQKNGTYYHFQAAAAGAGGAMATQNFNSPDTFCPLGWQLPYSGTGGDYYDKSRSWKVLFNTYSIGFDDGTATDTAKIKSYPLSYVYSGSYYWNVGRLYYQSYAGYYWASTILNGTAAYRLDTYSSIIRPTNAATKAGGFAIRCTLGINNLEKLSMASA